MAEHLSVTGFFGYQLQGSSGSTTPGAAATGAHLGFGCGSGDIDLQSNNVKSRFIGSSALNVIKGGGVIIPWSWSWDSVHTCAPLKLINKTGGARDWFTISGGYNETSDIGWHAFDCKAASLSLSLAAGDQPGPLTGSLNGFALDTTLNTTAETVTDPTEGALMAYEAVLTLGGSNFESVGFDMTIGDSLKPTFVIKGAARTNGKVRLSDYLTEGTIDVTGVMTRLEPWSTSIIGDTVTSQASILRIISETDSSNIVDLTFAGLVFDNHQFRMPNGGQITYGLPFTAKTCAITSV